MPLSGKALSILQGLPRKSDRVFDTTAYALRMAFSRAVKRAEIDDFRFHDLRLKYGDKGKTRVNCSSEGDILINLTEKSENRRIH